MGQRTCSFEGCERTHKAKGFCGTHYNQVWRRRPKCKQACCNADQVAHGYCRPHEARALQRRRPADQERALARFRRSVEPDWETGCWMWQETPNEDGYGQFWVGKQFWYVHRFAYVWFLGGHPSGKVLDHICNRKLCVRPDHMWPISSTLNIKLRQERARAGGLEWWRDARGIPDDLVLAVWASKNSLPYGWTPPFGRDGDQFDEVGRLKLPPAASRLQHTARPSGARKNF